ncbi:hypothetical protein JXI42_04245 [bacterium]|nr:hypothetical protein [bacterium]
MIKNAITIIAVSCIFVLFLLSSGNAVVGFEPGDWVTYSNYRYIRKVALTVQYAYFLTTEGLIRYDRFEEKWDRPYTFNDIGLRTEISNMWAKNDELYFESRRRLSTISEYNLSWRAPHSVYDPEELSLPEGGCPSRFPLFFTPFGYLFRVDGYILDSHLREYKVYTCIEDEYEDLWMGTWGGGAMVASLRDLKLELLPFGMANSNVQAILVDGDSIWFGGRNESNFEPSGITLYDRRNEEWHYFDAEIDVYLVSDEVNCFAATKKYVFIGTELGLVVYLKEEDRFRSYTVSRGIPDDEVTALCIKGDELWVGTESGIAKCRIGIFDFELTSEIHFPVVYELIDDGVTLWAATRDGAYFLTEQGWRHLGTPDGYLDAPIWSIAIDDSFMWFAGQLGVLKMNTNGGERELFPVSTILPKTSFNKIRATERYIWLASNSGVLRFRKLDESWQNYTEYDGLSSNRVWTIAPDGDYIWFGTRDGATRFYWNEPSRLDF